MFEDLADDLPLAGLDEGEDHHGPGARGARQRVGLMHALDQHRPQWGIASGLHGSDGSPGRRSGAGNAAQADAGNPARRVVELPTRPGGRPLGRVNHIGAQAGWLVVGTGRVMVGWRDCPFCPVFPILRVAGGVFVVLMQMPLTARLSRISLGGRWKVVRGHGGVTAEGGCTVSRGIVVSKRVDGEKQLSGHAPDAPESGGAAEAVSSSRETRGREGLVLGRRGLLKAGLLAAPMIATLRARPAHAASSLGSLGINYGVGFYQKIEENGQEVWAPVDENGEVYRTSPGGEIDHTRRSGYTEPISDGGKKPKKSTRPWRRRW